VLINRGDADQGALDVSCSSGSGEKADIVGDPSCANNDLADHPRKPAARLTCGQFASPAMTGIEISVLKAQPKNQIGKAALFVFLLRQPRLSQTLCVPGEIFRPSKRHHVRKIGDA
jgi:hypothetical protein